MQTAVEEILAQGGDADDVLRRVVAAVHERGGYTWAGVLFVEDGTLTLGPEAGTPDASSRRTVPVVWQGVEVAQLAVAGGAGGDGEALDAVAGLIAGHCLVGWDTGGEGWEP